MLSRMSSRVALLASVLALTSLAPATALADIGHVGLVGGVMTVEEANETQVRPRIRTEIAFRLWGPFELGGYVQVGALGLPAELASFGGGVLFQLRPDTNFFGFVPHAEVAGSRITLPASEGRVDTWAVSVGGGLGYEVGAGFVLEARVNHQWYFDQPDESAVGTDGWTFSGGFTYRLPD